MPPKTIHQTGPLPYQPEHEYPVLPMVLTIARHGVCIEQGRDKGKLDIKQWQENREQYRQQLIRSHRNRNNKDTQK